MQYDFSDFKPAAGGAIWCAMVAHRPRDAKSSARREGRYPPTWRGARVPARHPNRCGERKGREWGGRRAGEAGHGDGGRTNQHKSNTYREKEAQSRERKINRTQIERKRHKSNTNPAPPCARRHRTTDVRWSSSRVESRSPWRSLRLLVGAQLPRGPNGKRESLVLRADLKHGGLELAADPSWRHLLHRPGLLHGELEAIASRLAAPPRQPRAAAGQIEGEEAESSSYSQGRIEEDGDGGRGRAVLLPSSFRELRLPRAQRRGLAAGQSS
nr:unnamed protein product [Digitaria exilis]